MATRAKEVTAKAATNTNSPKSPVSVLRADAPKIDSIDELVRKHEQVFDGLERGTVTGKIAEQMNMTMKGIRYLRLDLPLKYMSLLAKHKGKVPIPREPMLRRMIGLPEAAHPNDASLLWKG